LGGEKIAYIGNAAINFEIFCDLDAEPSNDILNSLIKG
jgi:hypothetical protein